MKTASKTFGRLVRLGAMASALLLGQQALAVGTDAGVTVSNTTSVEYDVGGNTQPAVVSNQADFLVDRRVDFTLSADGVHEVVNPDGSAISFDFTLQNDSNSTMDYEITLTQLLPADPAVNGNTDTGADVPSAVLATVYVDDIAEDANTVITVNAVADNTLTNGDIANIQVTAIARDPSGNSGAPVVLADTSGVADDPTVLDNVLANGGAVPGEEVAGDGIIVESAEVTVTKSYTVRYDPINGVDPNAKAIPGAVIEYLILIDNTGPVDATGIVITDTVDSTVEFVNASNNPEAAAEPYGGGTGNIDFGNGASVCRADADAADGCTLAGADLTIAGSDLAGTPITVPATSSLEIRFRILIPAGP